VDPDHGGTLGIDIDSTIEKKGNIWWPGNDAE
jgi:hypothetical protein